jgi:hypothetical protein
MLSFYTVHAIKDEIKKACEWYQESHNITDVGSDFCHSIL